MYSTNINKTKNGQFIVAKRIVKLNIDLRVKNSDFTFVSEIASAIEGKNSFSFATKYCSLHFWGDHPIYDRHVENMLKHFKKKNQFAKFTTSRNSKDLLNQHPKFYDVMKKFQEHYGLEADLRKIEKYLWHAAKYKYKL